jgi:DeoR/GlpR family transcriptional regulator of sugar metabolism
MTGFDTPEKKVALALALASGLSVTAAAGQAGVSESTARRRLAKPAFRRLVARLRGQMLEAALGRMAENMTRAADKVARLIDSDNEAIALRAARTLMSLGLRLRDSVELADRVHEIERELARKKGVAP